MSDTFMEFVAFPSFVHVNSKARWTLKYKNVIHLPEGHKILGCVSVGLLGLFASRLDSTKLPSIAWNYVPRSTCRQQRAALGQTAAGVADAELWCLFRRGCADSDISPGRRAEVHAGVVQ